MQEESIVAIVSIIAGTVSAVLGTSTVHGRSHKPKSKRKS